MKTYFCGSMRSLVLAIVVFTSLLSTSCHSNSKDVPDDAINPEAVSNDATASGKESKSLMPKFDFPVESYDFGTIEEGKSVSYAFKFKNSGQSDLLISSANGSCGCTVADYPKKAVEPGKEGVINVTFNSQGKQGMQHKTVTLIANTVPNSKVLTITGEVTGK